MITAAEVHARVGTAWPIILAQLGIGESYLRLKKEGPCPVCGGKDRFTFDNRKEHGDYFCRTCGPGDDFTLLMRTFRWSFPEAIRQVAHVAGLHRADNCSPWFKPPHVTATKTAETAIGRPTYRVRSILRTCCAVNDCDEAVAYLSSRGLWPLPDGCTLHAHASLDYFERGQSIGRYSGLVAEVSDIDGELVTAHITYLERGLKIHGHEPRKQLSKVEGRKGCAVRLMHATDALAIAEGIETSLAAAVLFKVPAWAALNTALLARFEPPSHITRLIVCADLDEAGLTAAAKLMQRMQGRVRFELQLPKLPAKDFNEQLQMRHDTSHIFRQYTQLRSVTNGQLPAEKGICKK